MMIHDPLIRLGARPAAGRLLSPAAAEPSHFSPRQHRTPQLASIPPLRYHPCVSYCKVPLSFLNHIQMSTLP
eukprot:768746-Hanusia_phi.AAC.5